MAWAVGGTAGAWYSASPMICLSILQDALAQGAGAPQASIPWPALAAAGAIVAAGATVATALVVQARAKQAAARLERLEVALLDVAKALAATRDQARELDLRRVEHALLIGRCGGHKGLDLAHGQEGLVVGRGGVTDCSRNALQRVHVALLEQGRKEGE